MSVGISILAGFLLIILGFAALALLQSKWQKDSAKEIQDVARQIMEAQKQDQSLQLLQKEVLNMRDQLNNGLAESARMVVESQKSMGDRLDRAAQVVGNVQKSLGTLEEATKQVFLVGKDVAQLNEILRAPKMRGSFGEYFLGDLLGQMLPAPHYSLQYGFKSGDVVDAVVRLGRLVPVDAKFPLENFKRLLENQNPQEKTIARRKFIFDVKRHIDAIADKYIRPDEGTFDFALMYIPAENVYYEVIIRDDTLEEEASLMSYAFAKHVVPVSPNSFYAYLHTIALGLKGMKIEENAKAILEQLSRLQGDFGKFKGDFETVGKHLVNAHTKFEDAEKRLVRFEDRLVSAGESAEQSLASPEEKSPSALLATGDKPASALTLN